MMKWITTFSWTSILVFGFACSSEQKGESREIQAEKQDSSESLTTETPQQQEEKEVPAELNEMELDDVPFKYPCDFDFTFAGIIEVSESRHEEILTGKGWDSGKGSCTWVYGEHIYNNFFPDSVVTEYRTHLVDLDSSQIKLTPEFLASELFKSHLIATTINGNNIFETRWDPNKTGKYQKPRQWVD